MVLDAIVIDTIAFVEKRRNCRHDTLPIHWQPPVSIDFSSRLFEFSGWSQDLPELQKNIVYHIQYVDVIGYGKSGWIFIGHTSIGPEDGEGAHHRHGRKTCGGP